MKKKLLSLLLISILLIFSFPTFTVNAEGVCVAKIGTEEYTSLDDAIAAAETGQTVNIIVSGVYELPIYIDKNITISAVDGVTANCHKEGSYGYISNGCNFNNITFSFGQYSYSGFQHAGKIKMTNCTLNGYFNSYGDMEFITCTFNAPGSAGCPSDKEEYSMWTYGDNILYENCNFNCAGKCINVYIEGMSDRKTVRFNNCTFDSTKKNKAAINVKEVCEYDEYDLVLKYDVYIDENCKIASGSEDFFPTPESSNDRTEIIDRLVQVDDKITEEHVTYADSNAGVNVYWKGQKVYSTYSTPSEEYTVPVEGEDTVQIEATITEGNAEVKEISAGALEEVAKPEKGKKSTTDTIVIDLSGAEQEVTGVTLTKSTVKNLADVTASNKNDINNVEIALTNATVTLDAKALDAIYDQTQCDTIQLVVDDTQIQDLYDAQKESLSKYEVASTFEAYFEDGEGNEIHDFKGGAATVSLKFEPEAGKKTSNYKVYYVKEDGKMTKYATRFTNGMLKFATTHFSDYAIVYNPSVDVLLLKAKASGSKAVQLSWNGMSNATKYVVYGAKCGKKYRRLKTTSSKSYTVKKIAGKKLKAHNTYKFYVVGYDAVGNKVQSRSIHFITANTQGRYANVKSIKAKKSSISLTLGGESKKVGATYKMYKGRKHIRKSHGAVLRYITSNPSVATVSNSGWVKAKGVGTATIYIIDIGGKSCKTTVVVK